MDYAREPERPTPPLPGDRPTGFFRDLSRMRPASLRWLAARDLAIAILAATVLVAAAAVATTSHLDRVLFPAGCAIVLGAVNLPIFLSGFIRVRREQRDRAHSDSRS